MLLASSSSTGLLASSRRMASPMPLVTSPRVQQTRLGAGKEVREFREDTGEVVVPGQTKAQTRSEENALYVDEAAAAVSDDGDWAGCVRACKQHCVVEPRRALGCCCCCR
jgi:hypothetical protein